MSRSPRAKPIPTSYRTLRGDGDPSKRRAALHGDLDDLVEQARRHGRCAHADTLVLASGDQIHGEIIEWTVDHVLIEHPQLRTMRIELDQFKLDAGATVNRSTRWAPLLTRSLESARR
ncbi:MAG: hypothetical protein E4H03_03610 [Myxococcales bacterium]|nr:MAG: hypothetical protein E4H03_03610 [Myxococcales bacterium]